MANASGVFRKHPRNGERSLIYLSDLAKASKFRNYRYRCSIAADSDKAPLDVIEYEVDELDLCWLELYLFGICNKDSRAALPESKINRFEFIMNYLEKTSEYRHVVRGDLRDDPRNQPCCICNHKSEAFNEIVVCNVCQIPVHQNCYGVPILPKNPWLCKKCIVSPGSAVKCQLCPNYGGAYKPTYEYQWAHVVCAFTVPEPSFGNHVYMEPIDNMKNIASNKWSNKCYICKTNSGASVQCTYKGCTEFMHGSCAARAELKFEREVSKDGKDCIVLKPYCTEHSGKDETSLSAAPPKLKPVFVPTVSEDNMKKLKAKYAETKHKFVDDIYAYWKLKRHSVNGSPLIIRLRGYVKSTPTIIPKREYSSNFRARQFTRPNIENLKILLEETKYRFARLSSKKAITIKAERQEQLPAATTSQMTMVQQREQLDKFFISLIDRISLIDKHKTFAQPVDPAAVPDYFDVIKEPMDLSKMRRKYTSYNCLEDLKKDFDLMLGNCFRYNAQNTFYYKDATRLRQWAVTYFGMVTEQFEVIFGTSYCYGTSYCHVSSQPEPDVKIKVENETCDTRFSPSVQMSSDWASVFEELDKVTSTAIETENMLKEVDLKCERYNINIKRAASPFPMENKRLKRQSKFQK